VEKWKGGKVKLFSKKSRFGGLVVNSQKVCPAVEVEKWKGGKVKLVAKQSRMDWI